MWGIPNSGYLQKIGQNERLGVPSTKWLSLTHERFPHHTRPTFTRSSLLRGLAPHTARNKRSAVACHFFTRHFGAFWGKFHPEVYRLSCRLVQHMRDRLLMREERSQEAERLADELPE